MGFRQKRDITRGNLRIWWSQGWEHWLPYRRLNTLSPHNRLICSQVGKAVDERSVASGEILTLDVLPTWVQLDAHPWWTRSSWWTKHEAKVWLHPRCVSTGHAYYGMVNHKKKWFSAPRKLWLCFMPDAKRWNIYIWWKHWTMVTESKSSKT